MRILFTYSFLLLVASATGQSFNGKLKIENITFPEGNQLSYVIDIAQDRTGLIWMRPDWNFYTYNGHRISRVDPEVMGFVPPNTRRFHADSTHRYFYMVRDSLVVYHPSGSIL